VNKIKAPWIFSPLYPVAKKQKKKLGGQSNIPHIIGFSGGGLRFTKTAGRNALRPERPQGPLRFVPKCFKEPGNNPEDGIPFPL